MKKFRGFSVVELMVTFAILGLLTVISIPNILTWNSRKKYEQSVKDTYNLLSEARSYAISEKKCSASAPATSWTFKISQPESSSITKRAEIFCNYVAGGSLIQILVNSEEISRNFTKTTYYKLNTDNPSTMEIYNGGDINITFASGTGRTTISPSSAKLGLSFAPNFLGDSTSSPPKILCFNTVGGYPYFAQTTECGE